MTKPTCVIVDMDGTLANVKSIRFHVDGSVTKTKTRDDGTVVEKPVKNFDAFHAASEFVPANEQAVDFCIQAENNGHVVLIVTARMRKWEGVTTRFLEREIGSDFTWHPHIFMRADGDNRKDVEVKREIFAEISKTFDVVAACDDNPAIVALWEEMGIPTTVIPGWDHDQAAKAATFINAVK